MESNDYAVLDQPRIANLIIGGSVFPYLTGSDIHDLGIKFNIQCNEATRMDDMMYILNKLHYGVNTEKFLYYLFHVMNINQTVNIIIEDNKSGYFKYDDISYITNNSVENSKTVAARIRKDMLDKINIEISTADKRLIDNGSSVFIVEDNDVQLINDSISLINEDYVKNFFSQVKANFISGDLDNVITKSRSLLESVFKKILNDHHIEYKNSGDIKDYRSKAYDCLNMKYNKEWNTQVANMLNGINKIVDSVSNMRNIGGDAHGKSEAEYNDSKVNITEAEAELVLNISFSVAMYYLKVNQRSIK